MRMRRHTNPEILEVVCDCVFFFNDTATTEIYTLSLHDALPISPATTCPSPEAVAPRNQAADRPLVERTKTRAVSPTIQRSEEHTSELQSQFHLVCRLLLEKKKKI